MYTFLSFEQDNKMVTPACEGLCVYICYIWKLELWLKALVLLTQNTADLTKYRAWIHGSEESSQGSPAPSQLYLHCNDDYA
jgi:hypothetical protein